MFNYMFNNPREYNEILQFVTLFLLFVIGAMIYYMSENTDELKQEISDLELECPKCPEHPEIPSCPKCPDVHCGNNDNNRECPDCNCPENNECPPCNDSDCPTVDDIVTGIFPGRNPGITSGGRYFDIMANESYELMPNYDFYEPSEAFPSDSILSAPDNLLAGNPNVPANQIDNTSDNNFMNTDYSRDIDSRGRAPPGDNTGAVGSGSYAFADDSVRTMEPDNVERARRAAEDDGGDPDSATEQQADRDQREQEARSDLGLGL
jgi:hypothetical protein